MSKPTPLPNGLKPGKTLEAFVRQERIESYEVVFCKRAKDDPDEVILCPPDEADFLSIYMRADTGVVMPLHDAAVSPEGAEEIGAICAELLGFILDNCANRPIDA